MAKPIVSNRLSTAKTLVSQLIGNTEQRSVNICRLFNIAYNQQKYIKLLLDAIHTGNFENYDLSTKNLDTLHQEWCKILPAQDGVN